MAPRYQGSGVTISIQITCDVYGEQRKETNHWFKVTSSPHFSHVVITPFPAGQKTQRGGTKIVCGRECPHKMIDRMIQ